MSTASEVKIWSPGSPRRALFLGCPVFECLLHGTRGSGKTEDQLIDFAQHVGKGFGAAWKGILFRQTYPQLAEVITRSHSIFRQVWPASKLKYNQQSHEWTWATGEVLRLRYAKGEKDYWEYHGHEYTWLGLDELTNWPTPNLYLSLFSIVRSAVKGIPLRVRPTTNPWGLGHSWCKKRFIDTGPPGTVTREESTDPVTGEKRYLERTHIKTTILDNPALLRADPSYYSRLQVQGDTKRRAWLDGDWNISAGGILDGFWDADVHKIEPFEIPKSWKVDRTFDWGSSSPYSVGFWAESDGSEVTLKNGERRHFPRGTLFRVAELYGWNGSPNEGTGETSSQIASRVIEVERGSAMFAGREVKPGSADPSIFDVRDGRSIASEMAANGVRWERAATGPGSRKSGYDLLKSRLIASKKWPMEEPGIFVFSTCEDGWLRTVPYLPMDEKNKDDTDPSAEDHAADETRYRLLGVSYASGAVPLWY